MTTAPTSEQSTVVAAAARLLAGRPVALGQSVEEVAGLVRRYLGRVGTAERWSAPVVAGCLGDHLELGRRRAPGADLLAVVTPSSEGKDYRLGASSLVQIVTDNLAYLVDSVAGEIRAQGWSIRRILHPRLSVSRDEAGDLTGWTDETPGSIDESWVVVEVYPPLGEESEPIVARLADGLRQVMAEVRLVADDTAAMRQRLADTMADLTTATDPESRWTSSAMSWAADGHFVLLGARDYDVVGEDYRPVAGTGLGVLRDDAAAASAFVARPVGEGPGAQLVIAKDSVRSRVHRTILRDYIGLRRFDPAGRLIGERRFLGLFTPSAYTESVVHIPGLVDLYRQILDLAGYEEDSHGGRQVLALMDSYPRDELFGQTASRLLPVLLAMADLDVSHYEVRAFVDPDPWDRTLTVLVFLPRDRYNTASRERLQDLLLQRFSGTEVSCHTQMTDAPFARLYFRITRPAGAGPVSINVEALEASLSAATRSWGDQLGERLHSWPSDRRGVEFSRSYQDTFSPGEAVIDLELLNRLTDESSLVLSLHPSAPGQASLKVFSRAEVTLAQVMPLLGNLGATITAERPYDVRLRGADLVIYEFLCLLPGVERWTGEDRDRFTRAFEASYRGWTDSDRLLSLVSAAGLDWVQLTWLRALVHYLRQAGLPYSTSYMRQALIDNPAFARALVEVIETKADPGAGRPSSALTAAARRDAAAERLAALTEELREVASLDHDRILRALIAVAAALVRTNAFTCDLAGGRQSLAFKFLTADLEVLPQPRPRFEIWVHSPRVEGVHLRFGPVARGGLRWSDRAEDFRTEILGLVKAQMVKNAVIVPVGAKGGFIARRAASPTADRARWLADGQAAYQEFVAALLSVTDNIVDGSVVTPDGVVALDDPDPYLVVAADKGTATFSDLANAIAEERGFWLGDAFASGGSKGFDHKAMGITARGAWESARRHLHELGIDPDRDDFSVVGIGDMSGDVFGNGMMLSGHIKLVCAFDHRHVFVDPTPDPATSLAERRRLFALPRSSWADYAAGLISAGGGVYGRDAKAIPITDEARAALGLTTDAAALTPDEYIHAALQAPVDLLWNGGIGTYVKGAMETAAQVGDKANDGLRVNGGQVRARCAVEGGNLGWTQLGRIEYARAGGKINADFIDNSAGVDTSDHEVNIKILLAAAQAAGRLTAERRNELLAAVTDDVAEHVLAHNADQNLALADEDVQAARHAGLQEDWISALVEAGYVDRGLEFLPGSAEMADRIAHGQGLSNPELATLLSWTKIYLADLVLASDLPDDPFVADRLTTYFPAKLGDEFRAEMESHRLRREIITTVAVNRFVDSQGVATYHQLHSDTGAGPADVIRAQLVARSVLRSGQSELAVRRSELPAEAKSAVRFAFRREVERGTRWMLHNRPRPLDIKAEIERFAGPMQRLSECLPDCLTESGRVAFTTGLADWRARGVSGALARSAVVAVYTPHLFGMVGIAAGRGRELDEVAEAFFLVRERFGIQKLQQQVERLPQTDRWTMRARASLRDEMAAAQTALTDRIVTLAATPGEALERFLRDQPAALDTAELLAELGDSAPGLAPLTVALRAVRSLLA